MHAPAWSRIMASWGAVLAAALLLAGCPVPIPAGYQATSRENLGEGAPAELIVNSSAREDVLLLLGEPDFAGPRGEWLSYGSVRGEGGVLFILCSYGGCLGGGSEKMQYRRLVVSFDADGLLTGAEFVDRECWEGIFGSDRAVSRSAPCLSLDGAPLVDPETPGDSTLPQDLLEFAAGRAVLVTPGWMTGQAEAAAAGRNTRQAKEQHEGGQWVALARTVLADRYGDDLRWYFLGRAAEGLGLCDAASLYYGRSGEMSERFVTRCQAWAGVCAGIRIPEALEERLAAVAALRAAGECVAPPAAAP